MVRVRPLSDQERRELKSGARREVGRVSERMHAVLLSARGYEVGQIATMLEYDEATVRRWLERFEAEGLEGLQDRPRSGRPRSAGAVAQDSVRRALEAGPEACGHQGVALWTVVLLQTHLLVGLGLQLSRSSVRRLVHAMGYAWRRPRHVLPKDPETASKMRHICSTLLAAPANAVVLCLDECDIHLMPLLRAMWTRRGQQADVPTPGYNRKRGIFGALELEGGALHYTITLSKKAVDVPGEADERVPGPSAVPGAGQREHPPREAGPGVAEGTPSGAAALLAGLQRAPVQPDREGVVAPEAAGSGQPAAR